MHQLVLAMAHGQPSLGSLGVNLVLDLLRGVADDVQHFFLLRRKRSICIHSVHCVIGTGLFEKDMHVIAQRHGR